MEKKQKIIKNFWKNKKVLITGHTGFKGAWMSLILAKLGSKIFGYSLKPNKNQVLYKSFNLKKKLYHSTFADILDRKKLKKVIDEFKPEIVFHFAAQPLVIDSYKYPHQTLKSNVIGLSNLLELCNHKYIRSIIIVTSDKCYENSAKYKSFSENNPLGGKDVYSASKACAELVANSFRLSFFEGKKIATVRAGNVIGGGDFSDNRIIPDFFRSVYTNKKLTIRNPSFIRPWQNVFDVLNGYMIVAEKLYFNQKKISQAWNFGPSNKNMVDVRTLVNKFNKCLTDPIKIKFLNTNNYFEEQNIFLNSKKANKILNWQNKHTLNQSVKNICEWYINYKNNKNILQKSEALIEKYFFGI